MCHKFARRDKLRLPAVSYLVVRVRFRVGFRGEVMVYSFNFKYPLPECTRIGSRSVVRDKGKEDTYS